MTVDTQTAIAVGGTIAAVVTWSLHLAVRVTAVERQCYSSEAHQRIIIAGLVRIGVVRQTDVDELRQKIRDEEHKKGVVT